MLREGRRPENGYLQDAERLPRPLENPFPAMMQHGCSYGYGTLTMLSAGRDIRHDLEGLSAQWKGASPNIHFGGAQ